MTRRLLRQVRHLGRHTSDEEAEGVLDTVLAVLGSQLTGGERRALAAVLPDRARTTFASRLPLPEPVAAPAFVETVAHALDAALAVARWDTSCVPAALADLAGERLTDRILAYLPRGCALLFGRAELAAA
ncbi:DUF2267 domain-containing protein [Streptomyces sp. NPDC092296]|uniref:DUF2267 domain-containing protein n=1 Tax=Streptomyces sp. NPDC092296 TaxID=3366012 RepID=UPI0038278150